MSDMEKDSQQQQQPQKQQQQQPVVQIQKQPPGQQQQQRAQVQQQPQVRLQVQRSLVQQQPQVQRSQVQLQRQVQPPLPQQVQQLQPQVQRSQVQLQPQVQRSLVQQQPPMQRSQVQLQPQVQRSQVQLQPQVQPPLQRSQVQLQPQVQLQSQVQPPLPQQLQLQPVAGPSHQLITVTHRRRRYTFRRGGGSGGWLAVQQMYPPGAATPSVSAAPAARFCPLADGVEDNWTWSKRHRSKEVVLSGPNARTVHFHPNWSKGTAGVQGKRSLNNGRYYWELHVSQRVFGTSIMFGIGTKSARLHANAFRNLLGENEHGWGLSHKGVLWHKGVALLYTKRFRENHPTQIGILFDGIEGTLTYYKDGKCLGVAFRGLDQIDEPLYPIVCSTAAKTEMTLKCTMREFVNLQDRCRAVIMRRVRNAAQLEKLKLPTPISEYLGEVIDEMEPLRQVDNYDILCDL